MNKFVTYDFYNPALHRSLEEGSFCKDFNPDIYKGGVYLVMFRAFPKDNQIELVYNYLYYPSLFINSLIGYLYTRTDFRNSYLFKEWGDFFCIIDVSLINSPFMSELIDEGTKVNDHYQELYFRTQRSINEQGWDNFYMMMFDIIKRLTIIRELDMLVSFLDYIVNKKYFDFICELCPEYRNDSKISSLKEPKNYYLLKDCLFMVRDLDSLLKLTGSKYTIVKSNKKLPKYIFSKGNTKLRAQPNSINGFLNSFDEDYRNNLYSHHLHQIRLGLIPYQCELPRSKFTFRNIHMNLGNVRFYSSRSLGSSNHCSIKSLDLIRGYSTKALSKDIPKNRQELFDENYYQILSILETNGYVGTKKVQEEIEWFLLRQENIFSDMNMIKTKLKYNDETFELLKNKRKELCIIFNKWVKTPEAKQIKSKKASVIYLPLFKTVIKELGCEKVADIILSYFMYILNNPTVTEKIGGDKTVETPGIPSIAAYERLGKVLFNKYLFSLYTKSDLYKKGKDLYKNFRDIHKNDPKNSYIYENESFNAYFGGDFVKTLLDVDLLIEVPDIDPAVTKKKTTNYLRVWDDIRKIFLKNNFKIHRLPQRLPMVCEPKNYSYNTETEEVELGGYLLNGKYYVNELIKDKVGHEISSKLKEDNLIIDTVNGINKTPFKINIDTLNYIRKHAFTKGIIININDENIIPKSFINNPYSLKRINKKDRNKYRSILSKIQMERNILNIAITFSKMEKIYFPVRLEFRGRILCNTEFFDYQKNDLAKGLISFARPGKILKSDNEAIKYFKGYGANMYGSGLDKKSLNYRVKWVDDNSEKLLNFESNDIVDGAENKSCFISFCFEYKRFIQFINDINSVMFYTYLPIQLDATCNGYQHLTLLTKEIKILGKLNLDKSSYDDDPNDFYRFLLTMTRSHIDSEIERVSAKLNDTNIISNIDIISDNKDNYLNSKNYLNSLELLKQLDLGRNVIKYAIMKESYSAGIKSLVEDILSDPNFEQIIDEKGNIFYMYKKSLKVTYGDIKTYVFTLKHVIKLVAPKINKLIKYLNSVVNICIKLRIPIPWVTVSGLEIPQSYLKEKDYKIAAFTFTKTRYTFRQYLPSKEAGYDYKKQLRAIRPNLIHSLDASVIALLYKSLQGIDLYTVHDCFAVTADNVPILIKDLQHAYIEIYVSNNYLLQFDTYLRTTIYNQCGEKVLKDTKANTINIPNGNDDEVKYKTIPFPDVMEVVELTDGNDWEERIRHAVYVAI